MVRLKAIIRRAGRDRYGEWQLVIAVPQDQAIQAAGLATQTDVVFDVTFKPEENA